MSSFRCSKSVDRRRRVCGGAVKLIVSSSEDPGLVRVCSPAFITRRSKSQSPISCESCFLSF
ncbi:hypothetical protein E2C01_023883 [Portunus trituberculatus]|uniref:Uncharacterized protein n=1 Tax=Portunus trituberculatus TaxID=210409 RepID=A0A5B7EBR2_PORTR|nr:hypothetical protein [Portunus trituberculatus]